MKTANRAKTLHGVGTKHGNLLICPGIGTRANLTTMVEPITASSLSFRMSSSHLSLTLVRLQTATEEEFHGDDQFSRVACPQPVGIFPPVIAMRLEAPSEDLTE